MFFCFWSKFLVSSRLFVFGLNFWFFNDFFLQFFVLFKCVLLLFVGTPLFLFVGQYSLLKSLVSTCV